MASGRLVFNDDTDNITGGTATVTHFIRNVADPDTNTVVRSTELTGGDLIFNLVQDNILSSTIEFGTPAPAALMTLNWDVAASGNSDLVTVTEDTLNTRHYDSLRTQDADAAGGFTIRPEEGLRARGVLGVFG